MQRRGPVDHLNQFSQPNPIIEDSKEELPDIIVPKKVKRINNSEKDSSRISDFSYEKQHLFVNNMRQNHIYKNEIPVPFCKDSMIKCSELSGFFIFFLNIVVPTSGTLLSAFMDKEKLVNCWAILVFLLQLILLPFVFLGWLWAICHGFAIWRANKITQHRYKSRIVPDFVKR